MKTKKKHEYKYEYEMPVITFIGETSADRLGNLELDTQHYSWGKVKLPQGKTWKKDAKCFKAKDYNASTIYFFDNAPDLYVRFVFGGGRRYEYVYSETYKCTVLGYFKQSALYLTIKNYVELTALNVLNDLYKGCNSLYPLGRHFEDGILLFWKEHKLELGYFAQKGL